MILMSIMAKNYMKDGKWIDRPGAPVIHVCSECGNKYIKTRNRQKMCLICFAEEQRVAA